MAENTQWECSLKKSVLNIYVAKISMLFYMLFSAWAMSLEAIKYALKIILCNYNAWLKIYFLDFSALLVSLTKQTQIKNKNRYKLGFKQIWPRSAQHQVAQEGL